jgi:hypothetical protein
VALIRTDVSEDRIASIFRVHECEQAQRMVFYESLPIQELTTSLFIVTAVETSNLTRP